MATKIAYDANTNVIRLEGAHTVNPATGAKEYLDGNAVVQAVIMDPATGTAPAWASDPILLQYVAGSSGDFEARIEPILPAGVARYRYDLAVTASGSTAGAWNAPLSVQKRGTT